MSRRSEIAVDVDLRPGRLQWVLWAAAASSVGGAIVLAPSALRPLVAALALAWALVLRARLARPWRRLHWAADGSLELSAADGATTRAELSAVQYVTPWLVVLRLVVGRRRSAWPVWRAEQPEAARRLAQRLTAGAWRRIHLDRGD